MYYVKSNKLGTNDSQLCRLTTLGLVVGLHHMFDTRLYGLHNIIRAAQIVLYDFAHFLSIRSLRRPKKGGNIELCYLLQCYFLNWVLEVYVYLVRHLR